MKKKSTIAALAVLALSASFGLSACGSSSDTASTDAAATTSASASSSASASASDDSSDDGTGFLEIPVGDDQELDGILNVGAVYFQPVDMYPATGTDAAEANLHLEADIHALADNGYGYGAGDFVPDCTVKYTITNEKTNEVAAEGTFMQMNADDGPHYGDNIKLDEDGTYTLVFSIESPESNGWELHIDPETGVEKHQFWSTPLEAKWTGWEYTVQEW